MQIRPTLLSTSAISAWRLVTLFEKCQAWPVAQAAANFVTSTAYDNVVLVEQFYTF
jgi:hypothetical protein